jgi:hypothetical protein
MVFNMRVKTIEEIRYENFLVLVEEAGSVARFAKKMEKSYGLFSQIKNRSPESKTGKPKELGSKQAREIEAVFGREIGWMDHEQLDQEAQAFKKLPAEVRAWILKNAVSEEPVASVADKSPDTSRPFPGFMGSIPMDGGLGHKPDSSDQIEQRHKRTKE